MEAAPPEDVRPRGKPLRVRDVAERMGTGRQAVRALIHKGTIPAVQYGGRTSPWIVFERDLDDYVAGRYPDRQEEQQT